MNRQFAWMSLIAGVVVMLGVRRPGSAAPVAPTGGWIDQWELSGPHRSEYEDRKTKQKKMRDARQLFGIAFAPERPGDRGASWKPVRAGLDHAVDLGTIMPDCEKSCAYLRTCVVSPRAQAAQLEVGSDDGVIAWWNGRAVIENNALRTFAAGQDKRPVQLRKGCNTLLVKVTQDKADWKLAVRIVGGNGVAPADVQPDTSRAGAVAMVLPPTESTPQRFSGAYKGTRVCDGAEVAVVAHVLGRPNGNYLVNLLPAFDQRADPLAVLTGRIADGEKLDDHVELAGRSDKGPMAGAQWTATLRDDLLSGTFRGDRQGTFELKQVERKSSTFGAKPPEGAAVLLGPDSKDLGEFGHGNNAAACKWKLLPGGVMQVARSGSVVSRRAFRDHRLHIEFRSPYEPHHLGQARGNSGVYVQGRYEVQVLDSFGLEGKDNECGGIYKTGRPLVNMCYPPSTWQTYDIDFTAARFEGDKKAAAARVTVRHNGVVIHDDLTIPKPTGGSRDNREDQPGPLMLQDHGNPVEFRNIWVVEK